MVSYFNCFLLQIFGSRARVRWRALWLPGKEGQVNTQRGQEVLQTDHLSAGLLPQSLYMVRVLDFTAVLKSQYVLQDIRILNCEHSKLGILSLVWFRKVKCVVAANNFVCFQTSCIAISCFCLECFTAVVSFSMHGENHLKWSILQSLQSIIVNSKYHYIEILQFCTFAQVFIHTLTLTHTFWVKDW